MLPGRYLEAVIKLVACEPIPTAQDLQVGAHPPVVRMPSYRPGHWEAGQAAGRIAASKSLPGDCANSRLGHNLDILWNAGRLH